jgi:uncharacterized protein YqiB (DUF1249 family)
MWALSPAEQVTAVVAKYEVAPRGSVRTQRDALGTEACRFRMGCTPKKKVKRSFENKTQNVTKRRHEEHRIELSIFIFLIFYF